MACFCPFNRRNREGQKKEGESRESQEKQGRERERVAESEQREGRREGRSRAARERRGGGRCQAVGHPAQGPSLPSTMLTPRARSLLSRRRTESNPCPGDPGVGAPGRVLEGLQEGRGTGSRGWAAGVRGARRVATGLLRHQGQQRQPDADVKTRLCR